MVAEAGIGPASAVYETADEPLLYSAILKRRDVNVILPCLELPFTVIRQSWINRSPQFSIFVTRKILETSPAFLSTRLLELRCGTPDGIRTRISTLKGLPPDLLVRRAHGATLTDSSFPSSLRIFIYRILPCACCGSIGNFFLLWLAVFFMAKFCRLQL